MIKRNKSWEIILAGIAFIGIGIYLINNYSPDKNSNRATAWNNNADKPAHPAAPSLPGSIVIDLQDLESLKNLDKLRHLKELENLEQLEFEIKNLDKLIEQYSQNNVESESLNKGLQQLEQELQKLEQTDFDVKLQDKKLFINKNYNVDETEWTEVSSGVFVFKDTFSASDLKSLDFDVDFGNINVVGNNSSSGNITLRATGDIDDPAEIAKRLNIEKDLSANAQFTVTSTGSNLFSKNINLEATLTVPQNLVVNTKTSGGHINASNLSSDQQFNTSGGHITLTDLSGKTVAQTSGGHITSNRIAGDVKMNTGGGHIKIDKINGNLEAKTGGGHIEIQNAKGKISARTSGGNISSSVIEASEQLNFSTSAGNISLMLPNTINANLDVTGSSIELDDAFSFSGDKNGGRLTGTLNGGGLPIVIKCGFGNVTISSTN